jgi:hypothetical protein
MSLSFAQEEENYDVIFGAGKKIVFVGNTNLIGSYYHLGSYSKERPFGFIEQTFEVTATKKFWFGLGTGFNLYPGTAVIPIFATARYVKTFNSNWGLHVLQSYGRNIKMGILGFNSNRYYGDIGARYHFKNGLGANFGMGYLMNWDRWGGKSLSFTGSAGFFYRL